jgi:hypothetical protein
VGDMAWVGKETRDEREGETRERERCSHHGGHREKGIDLVQYYWTDQASMTGV